MPRVPQLSHQQLLENDYLYRSINALITDSGIDNDTQAMMGLALQERAQALGLLGCPEGFPYDWLEAKVGEAAEIQPQTLLLSKHVESLASGGLHNIAGIADMVLCGLSEEQRAEFRALFTPPQWAETVRGFAGVSRADSLFGWAVQREAEDGETEWLRFECLETENPLEAWTRDCHEAAIFKEEQAAEMAVAGRPECEPVAWPFTPEQEAVGVRSAGSLLGWVIQKEEDGKTSWLAWPVDPEKQEWTPDETMAAVFPLVAHHPALPDDNGSFNAMYPGCQAVRWPYSHEVETDSEEKAEE